MAQALARERLGSQRFPVVTALVFTALLVQDGGVLGTLSNLGVLLLLGVLAVRLAGPGWWLAAYLGAGLAGQPAGPFQRRAAAG